MTNLTDELFRNRREIMIKHQICARDVSSDIVLDAMNKIERHLFVLPKDKGSAYDDRPLGIGDGQTISQPYIVALMTELLELTGSEKILEIGTGSGYQTAILAELGSEVWTIERYESLSIVAEECLDRLGYNNIHFKVGDGTVGWTHKSPFDRIIVTAAAPKIPEILFQQLVTGGKMVVPVGERHLQDLKVISKTKAGQMESVDNCRCIFVPLIGEDGW